MSNRRAAETDRRQFLMGPLANSQESATPDHNTRPVPDSGVVQNAILNEETNFKPAGPRAHPWRREAYLQTFSKSAMACQFELMFHLDQYPRAAEAAMESFKLIDAMEERLSVYRSASEVSRINRTAFEEPQPVSEELHELLRLSLQISESTAGAFDITAGPLSEVWGFSRRQGRVPDAAEVAAARARVSWQLVQLVPPCRVHFLQPGVQINLGGIGKGFALDAAAELISQMGIGDFVYHGGQSSVVARGDSSIQYCIPRHIDSFDCEDAFDESHRSGETRMEPVEATDPIIEPVGRESIIKSADELREGWTIGISDPIQPGNRLAEVRLIDEALSTSGTGRQGFFHQGRRYGHLLDPRSGQPPDHFLSVTVIAASAAVADALSTAFFVMDLNAVRDYCHRHPDIRAIIVRRNSRADGMEIETLNFRPRDCNVLK